MATGAATNLQKMAESVQFGFGCVVVLASLASSAWAQSCAPPESMKARFAGKPDVEALNDLGVWFGEQKNYSCAADAFASSLQMDPHQKDFAHITFMFGASLYLTGDVKEAIPALQEAERFGYHDIKLHLLLAQALDATQAKTDAEMEWRAALEIDPENTDVLDSLSNDLTAQSNYVEVIKVLDTPRLVPQRTPQQAMNLGLAYARTGKPSEAARVLYDAVNTYPDSMPLAEQLAGVLRQLGKKDEAETVLEVARMRQTGNAEPAP